MSSWYSRAVIGNQTGGAESWGRKAGGRPVQQSRQEELRLSWGVEHISPRSQLCSQPNLELYRGCAWGRFPGSRVMPLRAADWEQFCSICLPRLPQTESLSLDLNPCCHALLAEWPAWPLQASVSSTKWFINSILLMGLSRGLNGTVLGQMLGT